MGGPIISPCQQAQRGCLGSAAGPSARHTPPQWEAEAQATAGLFTLWFLVGSMANGSSFPTPCTPPGPVSAVQPGRRAGVEGLGSVAPTPSTGIFRSGWRPGLEGQGLGKRNIEATAAPWRAPGGLRGGGRGKETWLCGAFQSWHHPQAKPQVWPLKHDLTSVTGKKLASPWPGPSGGVGHCPCPSQGAPDPEPHTSPSFGPFTPSVTSGKWPYPLGLFISVQKLSELER